MRHARERPLRGELQGRRVDRRERELERGVGLVDEIALGRPVRLDDLLEIGDGLGDVRGHDDVLVAPREQHATGLQHARAFGEEARQVEPVQCLRDADGIDARIGQ